MLYADHAVSAPEPAVAESVERRGSPQVVRLPDGRGARAALPARGREEMAAVAQFVRIDERSDASAGEWLLGCQFVSLPAEERCRLAKSLCAGARP